MKIKNTLEKAQAIIKLSEDKGWSEEELANVINLLHSELNSYSFGLSSDRLVDAIYPSE